MFPRSRRGRRLAAGTPRGTVLTHDARQGGRRRGEKATSIYAPPAPARSVALRYRDQSFRVPEDWLATYAQDWLELSDFTMAADAVGDTFPVSGDVTLDTYFSWPDAWAGEGSHRPTGGEARREGTAQRRSYPSPASGRRVVELLVPCTCEM